MPVEAVETIESRAMVRAAVAILSLLAQGLLPCQAGLCGPAASRPGKAATMRVAPSAPTTPRCAACVRTGCHGRAAKRAAPKTWLVAADAAGPVQPKPCECCPARSTKTPYLPPINSDPERLPKNDPGSVGVLFVTAILPHTNPAVAAHGRGPPGSISTHNESQAQRAVWLK